MSLAIIPVEAVVSMPTLATATSSNISSAVVATAGTTAMAPPSINWFNVLVVVLLLVAIGYVIYESMQELEP